MKALIICILFLSLFSSCFDFNNGESYSLIGTWELVEGTYRSPDKTVLYPSEYGQHLKIFVNDQFVTIWQDTSSNPGSIYPGFNGGRFDLKDGRYMEFHYFNYNKKEIGKISYFKLEFEKDRFFITDVGKDKKYGFYEEWKKLN